MARLRNPFAYKVSIPAINSNSDSESERAMRFVSYTEQHESRWFWETDAEGRLTYLSPDVASNFEVLGIRPIGKPLSEVFVV